MRCYRRALELDPAFPEAHNNLGSLLKDLGRLDEAACHYDRAVDLRPDYFAAYSNRLFTRNYIVQQSPDTLCGLARQYGDLVTRHAGRVPVVPRASPPAGRLRIGLVSGDLRNHPVAYFLEAQLRAADTTRLEFVAFPTQPVEDEVTTRIKDCCADWEPIYALDDKAAAELIRASGVQVLLDLSGHTAHNRLPVFAHRPAPVQASWLGYFATTGVAEMDYVIGDPHVAPPGEAHHFTETVWCLPEIYYCFTPPATNVEVSAPPALSTGRLTFGCFNNLSKINDAVVALWACVLDAVPDSRLLLKAPQLHDETVRRRTDARFAVHGINGNRLLLEPSSPRDAYLRAYHGIDIALDPFPFPGGTTSCEALWMGVPVLTRRGDRFLSHAGETILHNAGLSDWVAQDDDDYLAKAMQFGSDLVALGSLRGRLRQQVLASPLFDAPRFAQHFEKAMWGMWNRGAIR